MLNKKVIIASIVLVIAVAGLIYTVAVRTSMPYLQPVEYIEKGKSGEIRNGDPIKVIGTVVKDSVKKEGSKTFFRITDKKKEISIVYEDLLPDAFAEGREVILEGPYSEEPFVAVKMVAKCPSKYKTRLDKENE